MRLDAAKRSRMSSSTSAQEALESIDIYRRVRYGATETLVLRRILLLLLRVCRRLRVRSIAGPAAAAALRGGSLMSGTSREAERDHDGGEKEGDGFHARYV